MTLGAMIAKLRKENQLTQEELATQLFITRQAISNWEQNKSQPDLEKLQRLAEIFGVDMNTLLGTEETNQRLEEKVGVLHKYLIWSLVINFFLPIVWAIIGNVNFESIFISFVFFLCSITVYGTFGVALKNNDFTMVAGYNRKAKYNQVIVRKVVSLIGQQIVLSGLVFTLLHLMIVEFGMTRIIPSSLLLNGGLVLLYCIHIFATIAYVNYRYRDELFINQEEAIKQRKEGMPGLFFVIDCLVMTIGLMICFYIFNISSNTASAFKLTGIFMAWMIWDMIFMFMSNRKIKKNQNDHPIKKYSYSIIGSILTIVFLVLIFIMGYFLGN